MSTDSSGMDSDAQLLASEARSVCCSFSLNCLVLTPSQLVSQLYDPANAGNPAKINLIQEHLQVLQKGPHAWIIANDLLSRDNTGLRFFGALTFTVKINQDWYGSQRSSGWEELDLTLISGSS